MRMTIQTNVDKLVHAYNVRANKLAPVMRETTTKALRLFHAESKKQMKELIYDKPIPTVNELQREKMGIEASKGFEPIFDTEGRGYGRYTREGVTRYKRYGHAGRNLAWRRTGNLRRSEKKKLLNDFAGLAYNTAEYAEPRHEAGKPGRRRVRYIAPWQEAAIANTSATIKKMYRDALINLVLRGRR